MLPAVCFQPGSLLFRQSELLHIAVHGLYDPVGSAQAGKAVADPALHQFPGAADICVDGLACGQQLPPEGAVPFPAQRILFPP